MGMLSRKLRNLEGGRLSYWCQGCERLHSVAVGEGSGPRWGWNGDVEKPTFTPSVLTRVIRATRQEPPIDPSGVQTHVHQICHTFITDGRVQFLNDCTHQYAGQTLDLPDLPDDWVD